MNMIDLTNQFHLPKPIPMNAWGFTTETFNLSLEQEFDLAKLKNIIADLDADTLREALIEMQSLLYRKENVIKSLLKSK